MQIRDMTPQDADAVLAIYAEGIATGQATLDGQAPDWRAFDAARMAEPRLVAEIDGEVVGWAVLSGVSDRCVYGGVAENTVYVASKAQGRGVGKALLTALIEASEAAGLWTLQAGILAENEASIRLHQACGFRIVGRRERIGQSGAGPMKGQWRDVMLLERRSDIVGVE